MDVGKFKASGGRLMAWVVVPPLLVAATGLGSYGWRMRSEWRLQEAQALSDVLPSFVEARRKAQDLIGGLVRGGEGRIGSENELISFLQEVAFRRGFTIDAIQVARREKGRGQQVPVLNAVAEGSGTFSAIQLYINEIKSAQQLLSVGSIQLSQPRKRELDGLFEAKIVFDLLLVDEVLQTRGVEP